MAVVVLLLIGGAAVVVIMLVVIWRRKGNQKTAKNPVVAEDYTYPVTLITFNHGGDSFGNIIRANSHNTVKIYINLHYS